MGARRQARAAACAVALAAAARAGAATVTEPIARLSLEGGYDSNVLYEGKGGDTRPAVSPDLGLRVRDHRYDFTGTYGGDYAYYSHFASSGLWNHRLRLELDAKPSEHSTLEAILQGAYAQDPIGLALLGIFRTGRTQAIFGLGRVRAVWHATPRIDVAGTFAERLVRLDDRSGGAMHAPGVEALWRFTERLSAGGAYRLAVFQTFFAGGGSEVAYSHQVAARADYDLGPHLRLEGAAGPALWSSPTTRGIVPQATVTLLYTGKFTDLRLNAWHGLGIGSTAAPGLISAFEVGLSHHFGRSWLVHVDGGIWDSGAAPTGANSVLGYASEGEVSYLFHNGVRFGLAATRFARLDDPSPAFARTTVGLRVGWELQAR